MQIIGSHGAGAETGPGCLVFSATLTASFAFLQNVFHVSCGAPLPRVESRLSFSVLLSVTHRQNPRKLMIKVLFLSISF